VHKELLVGFVLELQQLNKIEAPLIDTPIEEILKDPKQYAINYMEQIFADNYDRFLEAYNLGKDFALSNTGIIIKGGKRYYLDGKKINEKLPPKYTYGNTLNNPDEMCHNCKFYVETRTGDYCAAWDADVREEYWCKKWQK